MKSLLKKIKGFTLIELLAVIAILAIVLLVAVPMVLNTLGNAKKQTLESNAKLLIKAVETDYATRSLNENIGYEEYVFQNGEQISGTPLEISGKPPQNGYITIDENGQIEMGMTDGISYIKKEPAGEIQETEEYEKDDINQPVAIVHVYGVTFDTAVSPTGTRINNAGDKTFTVNASTIDSDFDKAEIFSEIEEVTDGYGNVFVKIPKFYIKKTKNGTVWTYQIAKSKIDDDYYLPNSFYNVNTSQESDSIWIGKYTANSNGTRLESKSATSPFVSQTIATFRTYAMNNGAGYQLMDIHALDIIQTLFYIEFATLDSQSIMMGFTNNNNTTTVTSGTTNSVTTASGSPTSNVNGYHAMKYRGIENLYGNVYQFIDGINISNNRAYVSLNPSGYTSSSLFQFTGHYHMVGYLNANANGWIHDMGFDSTKPYVQLPTTTSTVAGAHLIAYKDYCFQNTGHRILEFGGAWYSSVVGGISSWYLGDPPNIVDFSVGSRLVKTTF